MKTKIRPTKNKLQKQAVDVLFDNLAHGDLGNLIEEHLDATIVGFEVSDAVSGNAIIYATLGLPDGTKRELSISISIE